jgi:hypothetical protein
VVTIGPYVARTNFCHFLEEDMAPLVSDQISSFTFAAGLYTLPSCEDRSATLTHDEHVHV